MTGGMAAAPDVEIAYPLASPDQTIINLDADHVFVVANIEPGLVTVSISKDFDEDSRYRPYRAQ